MSRMFNRHGFSLLSVILGLALAGAFAVTMMQSQTRIQQLQLARAMSDRMRIIAQAANQYLSANNAAISTAVAGGPIAIPVARLTVGGAQPASPNGLPTLQSAGLLPAAFVDTNPYGQRTYLVVRAGTAGALDAMLVTSGGQVAPDLVLGATLANMGAAGGVMLSSPAPGTAGQVMGYRAGWQAAATTYTAGGVGPSIGRLAMTVSGSTATVTGDYLWRTDTGVPEANRMHTNIDMNGNSLNNVNQITASQAALQVAANLQVSGTAASTLFVGSSTPATASTYSGYSYYMRPDDKTKLNALSARTFDIGAQITQTAGVAKNYPAGMTLADALPNVVVSASYYAEDNTVVPKPVCGGTSNNRTDLARIFAMPISSMEYVSPTATTTVNVSYAPVPVVSDAWLSSGGWTVQLNKTTTTVNSYKGINASTTVNAVALAGSMYASDLGSSWLLRIKKKNWQYPSGAVGDQPQDATYRNAALVQTACYYGN